MLKLPVPELAGGKPVVRSAPCTAELKAIVAALVERADAIRQGAVNPSEDNMLLVTTDGRKAALDLRLHDPSLPDHPESKVNLAVREIERVWRTTAGKRSAQLVFCDLSTPTSGKGFSVYEDMRDKLIATGVPAGEIAFIQDFDSDTAKHDLFRAVRSGRVRILFGSTQKMGAGTNVQERLIALHHLDAPWRPADVEQREGRILRQGNTNPEVQVYRYVTESSFDAYMWQTLETKARFIAQVMTGESDLRRIEDVDGAALTYAEVKAIASGNPLVVEKAEVDAEVARFSRLHSEHQESQYRLRRRIRHLEDNLPRVERRLEETRQDIGIRRDTRGDRFVIELDGQTLHDRGIAGELLIRHAQKLKGSRGERIVGHFAGFRLVVADSLLEGADILLKGAGTHVARVSDTALGTMRSVEHVLQNLEESVARLEQEIRDTQKRLGELAAQANQPFEYGEKFAALVRRAQEITDALDLTKNQGPNQLESSPSEDAQESADDDGTTLREMGFYGY